MKTAALLLLTLALVFTAFGQDEDAKDPKVEALYEKAEKLQDAGDFAAAVKVYDELVKLVPEDDDAYAGRGYCYLQLKKYDAAIADLDKTIELKPDDFYTYHTRGKAYFQKGDYEKAVEDHTQEIDLESARDIGRIGRGHALIRLGRSEEALPDFNRAIAGSSMELAYYARAVVLEKMGDKRAALADLRYYLDSVPDDAEARAMFKKLGGTEAGMHAPLIKTRQTPAAEKAFAAAFANLHMGWYSEAQDEMTALIKLEPKNQYAWYYRGWLLEMQASELNGAKAFADYTKAVTLDPKFAEAYLRRAWRGFFGSRKNSAGDIARARLADPKNARAAYYSALNESYAGRKPRALTLYAAALKLDPNYSDALISRGDDYLEAKQFARALADYQAVIKINPYDYRGYEGRSKVFCEQKKKDLAKADEEKMRELGSNVSFPCAE